MLFFASRALLFEQTFGQSLNVTQTYPVAVEGSNPLVSAVEGAKDVTIFCEVTSDGSIVTPQWTFISGSNPMGTILSFTVECGRQENFMVSPIVGGRRRNFTILTFNSSLDSTQISCGTSGTILVRFDLKLISKKCLKYFFVIKNELSRFLF